MALDISEVNTCGLLIHLIRVAFQLYEFFDETNH